MASLFENLLDNIETMIAGIVAGGGADGASAGYNFTWPEENVNAHDRSKNVPGPWVDILWQGEAPERMDGANGGTAINTFTLKLTMGFLYDEAPDNPIRQGQIDSAKALDDIKRLFRRDAAQAIGTQTGAQSFDRAIRETLYELHSNDVLNPGNIVTYWVAKFYTDRRNPDITVA